jgi:hypothetical protein
VKVKVKELPKLKERKFFKGWETLILKLQIFARLLIFFTGMLVGNIYVF